MLVIQCSIVHGIMLYYSAVGVMNIKRPIIDAYAGILVNCSNPKSISAVNDQVTLFNWSVRDDERKKNDFTTQLWYNQNIFDKDVEPTIGTSYITKIMQVSNKTVPLHIWDTAGQERYRAITSAYYRGAIGALLLYDISASFIITLNKLLKSSL